MTLVLLGILQRSVLLLFPAIFVTSAQAAQTCGLTPVMPNLIVKDVRKFSNEIVGGINAVPYSWPWQIVWCRGNSATTCSMICGGSVIHNEWVITAGHCVEGSTNSPGLFWVKAGVYDFTATASSERSAQIVAVRQIYLHPQYRVTRGAPMNDIALIRLKTPLTFTDQVQPVCLPAEDTQETTPPATGWVTGWGATSYNGTVSRLLRQVNVRFVSYADCRNAYGTVIDNTVMTCAGQTGKDSCQGDSGSALVAQTNGSWYEYGIASFGEGCGEPGRPGVYGRTSAWCSWISSTTCGQVKCGINSTTNGQVKCDSSRNRVLILSASGLPLVSWMFFSLSHARI